MSYDCVELRGSEELLVVIFFRGLNIAFVPLVNRFTEGFFMDRICNWRALTGVLFAGIVFIANLSALSAERQDDELLVKSVRGRSVYSEDRINWHPLDSNMVLRKGTLIRTGGDSTADFIMNSSGAALRLMPNTLVEATTLEKEVAGEEVITWTVLELRAGGIIGAQRRLDNLSTFRIDTEAGAVTIRGSEYIVLANGTVRCVAGQVLLNGDFAGNGWATYDVLAGSSFDPSTKAVAPSDQGLFTMVAADMDAVRKNGRSIKKESGHVMVKLDQKVSPTKGNNGVGNGQDPAPPGNPPPNDGPGTGPGNPGNKGGAKK